jgi:hypothetical protein
LTDCQTALPNVTVAPKSRTHPQPSLSSTPIGDYAGSRAAGRVDGGHRVLAARKQHFGVVATWINNPMTRESNTLPLTTRARKSRRAGVVVRRRSGGVGGVVDGFLLLVEPFRGEN